LGAVTVGVAAGGRDASDATFRSRRDERLIESNRGTKV